MKSLVLLCVFGLALAEGKECGENSHYNSCGSMCPLTCDNYNDPPKACVLMCNPGCHCDEGYVKTKDGRCVQPENCPAYAVENACGENQHYESCGTSCPLTCRNWMNPPKICNAMCNSGCYCDKGYVKTDDGRCVRPENCPASEVCGENQHYESCGTMCPLTCDNYNDPPKGCILMCNVGCHCDKGYVKTKDGRCVKPQNCPAHTEQCGTNERYNGCGTACPLTCDNYRNPPKICNLMCVIGCECEEGFVRNRDGQCVRPEECSAFNSIESDSCDLPAETGVCRGFFPRYYFDRTTGQCQKFVYGGCGGNDNNFETVEQCQKTCGVQASQDPCKLPVERGMCLAYFPRYYYNSETRKCQRFIYGGCGGNENNFKTQEECEKTCGSS